LSSHLHFGLPNGLSLRFPIKTIHAVTVPSLLYVAVPLLYWLPWL
jgi:hypothetical protein